MVAEDIPDMLEEFHEYPEGKESTMIQKFWTFVAARHAHWEATKNKEKSAIPDDIIHSYQFTNVYHGNM